MRIESSTADFIATGHYVRRQDVDGKSRLLRGVDGNKDQSYFLYDLPQQVLGRLVFPLGELTKADTRLEAERHGLRTAKKPESQDLCLADHHGSMKAFLDAYLPEIEHYLHYRSVDVSSVKELVRRWYPAVLNSRGNKQGTHRALDDVRESIAEMRFYREHVFVAGDTPSE